MVLFDTLFLSLFLGFVLVCLSASPLVQSSDLLSTGF